MAVVCCYCFLCVFLVVYCWLSVCPLLQLIDRLIIGAHGGELANMLLLNGNGEMLRCLRFFFFFSGGVLKHVIVVFFDFFKYTYII